MLAGKSTCGAASRTVIVLSSGVSTSVTSA